jgi:hypothetical protein
MRCTVALEFEGGLLQVRAALLNRELDARARRRYPWIGSRRISWPWQTPSHPF